MKKNRLLLFILVIPLVVFINSCMDDDINSKPPEAEILSIEEARQCFENYMSNLVETRSHGHKCSETCTHNHDYPLVTEFTPQWGKAVASNSANLASVDVPVLSEKQFMVLQKVWKKNKKGKAVHIMEVLQKLVVVKNPETGNTGVYHALIVPDRSYVASHGKVKFNHFFNSGDKKDFSGKIIYMLPGEHVPAAIDVYRKGKYIDGAFRLGSKETRAESLDKILSLMRDIHIRPATNIIQTRMISVELDEADVVWCARCNKKEEECFCQICYVCDELVQDCKCNDYCQQCGQSPNLCNCGEDSEPEYPGSGGGNGNTGYPGNNNGYDGNNNTVTKKINPYIKIPPKLATQGQGKCMPYCLAYALKLVGIDVDAQKLSKELKKTYKLDYTREGMSIEVLNKYIKANCHYSEYEGYPDRPAYTSAVDNGYFVMVGINNGVGLDGKLVDHALLVIGYNSDNTLVTLDPETGKERNLDRDDIISFSLPFFPK